MINLNIDISDLAQDLLLTQSQQDNIIEFAVDNVAAGFHEQWTIEAKNNLFKSRAGYINNLGVEKLGRFRSVVYLNPSAFLPNAIEFGKEAYDMKLGFMKSSKIKTTEGGSKYLTIPFRFGIPTAIGEGSQFAGVMPTSIHQAVMRAETRPDENKNGLRMSDIDKKYYIPESSTLRKLLKSEPFRKLEEGTQMTSIYAGLRRTAKGSGYVMFRRVSLNSPQDKFQHPGFIARNLAQKALNSYESEIPNIVGDSIRASI